jgi:hypothetical protein
VPEFVQEVVGDLERDHARHLGAGDDQRYCRVGQFNRQRVQADLLVGGLLG